MEAKTEDLEAHQFSTTTKLDGSAVFVITGGGAGGNVNTNPFSSQFLTGRVSTPGNAANTTFAGRTTLNFRTSFTGKDRLRIRLRGFTGNDITGTFSAGTGVGELFTTASGNPSNGNVTPTFDEVSYNTPLFGDNFRFWVGPFLQDIALLDTNRFAGADDENTFITAFHNQNQLFSGPIQFGSGAAFDWKISDQFSWRTLYITRDGGKSFGFGDSGLTGGTSKLATELEFRPSLDSAIRLQYAFINAQNTGPGSTIFGGGTNAFLVGTDPTFVSLGAAGLRNAQTSVLGINADWAITPTVGIFGRYATGDTTLAGVGNVNSSNYHFGFSFSDLFAQGNQLGISYGQPIRINSSPVGPDSGTENALEVYYRLKINPRFSLTPGLQLYFTPGNVAGNPTVTVGSLRASFQF